MSDRREWIGTASRLLAASSLGGAQAVDRLLGERRVGMDRRATSGQPSIRDEFPIVNERVYLDNAHVHPMSSSTRRAVEAYFEGRNRGASPLHNPDVPVDVTRIKAQYALLIGATASDVAFIPSTTVGENLVLVGLGIPRSGGNVVTDALHFDGSQYMYQS